MAFQLNTGEMGFGQRNEQEGHPGRNPGVTDSPSDFLFYLVLLLRLLNKYFLLKKMAFRAWSKLEK